MKHLAAQRLRAGGLTAAVMAVTVGAVITGCTSTVKGPAIADEQDLSSYRVEATSSSAAATSSSKAAAATRAKSSSCGTFVVNARPQVGAHNALVKAHNDRAPDEPQRRQAAIDAHNNLINRLNPSLSQYSGSLAANVNAALRKYIDDTRALLTETEKNPPDAEAMNGAAHRLEDTRKAANAACA